MMPYKLSDFRRGPRDIDSFYSVADALGIIDEHVSGIRKEPATLLFAIVSLQERKEDGTDSASILELIPRTATGPNRAIDRYRRHSADEELAKEIEQRLSRLQAVQQDMWRYINPVRVSYCFPNGPSLSR